MPNVDAWLATPTGRTTSTQRIGSVAPSIPSRGTLTTHLLAQPQKQRRQVDSSEAVLEEEKMVKVEGSQFFGGNKEKEEFFDPVAEAEAGIATFVPDTTSDAVDTILPKATTYDRFMDRDAFSDVDVAALAQNLQVQINAALYEGAEIPADVSSQQYTYVSSALEWTTPLSRKGDGGLSPLQELEAALEFYRRLDVAVVSGTRVSDSTFVLRWTISLAWPIFWEPRVLITGTSEVTVNERKQITRQVDSLDDTDLTASIARQVFPRFWDVYHIGMTPSTEVMPKLSVKTSPLAPYKVYDIPPQLVLQPTMKDLGTREDNNAGLIPNHGFSCVVKTMGPQKQRYVPTSPTEVQIRPGSDGNVNLKWTIPLGVEFLTNPSLLLPQPDQETPENIDPDAKYVLQPRRQVATVPYAGGPQDVAIASIRKRFFEQIVKDGLQPKLGESGRPLFFFWQNSVKTCFTEEGLGMAVYEYRPDIAKANEVGIELQVSDEPKPTLRS